MLRDHLASQSDMRLEQMDNGNTELKWCIFTKGIRAPIAKIIVDTRQNKLIIPGENYEPVAHIVNVFVRPEFRGKKLGEHLVHLAQTAMRENGFVWMTLEAEEKVEHHGRLVALYERCGFQIHPVDVKIPLEYNDDECYRKVPMRCNLLEFGLADRENMSAQPQEGSAISSSSSTSLVSSSTSGDSIPIPVQGRFGLAQFVEEVRREALHLLQMASLNVDILSAIDFIDQHMVPGSMESAFRTGMYIRSLGHPDWMELAGYLRHIGRIQEKWTDWHSPYMVQLGADPSVWRQQQDLETEAKSDSEEDEDDSSMPAKTGPLPLELCDECQPRLFIDPERYTQQGVDEAMLTWTPMEYTFLALNLGDRCSAPKEMAQVLRYSHCQMWLQSDEYSYLESYGDADVKQLTLSFKSCLVAAASEEPLGSKQLEEARLRLVELVDKYAADVRML